MEEVEVEGIEWVRAIIGNVDKTTIRWAIQEEGEHST